MRWQPALALLALGGLCAGCVRAPSMVYMVDEKTALEVQAAGELPALETGLERSLVTALPAPMTSGQLEGQGGKDVVEAASLFTTLETDAQLLDGLLRRRCLGEALSGLLEETPATCAGAVDVAAVTLAVQRANRNRRQIWAWIQKQRPEIKEEDIRRNWRAYHLQGLVCGAQLQAENGQWEIKSCGP